MVPDTISNNSISANHWFFFNWHCSVQNLIIFTWPRFRDLRENLGVLRSRPSRLWMRTPTFRGIINPKIEVWTKFITQVNANSIPSRPWTPCATIISCTTNIWLLDLVSVRDAQVQWTKIKSRTCQPSDSCVDLITNFTGGGLPYFVYFVL